MPRIATFRSAVVNLKALASPERVGIAILAALVVSALLLPWSEILPGESQTFGTFGFENARKKRSTAKQTTWRADVEYQATGRALFVALRHKHDEPVADLELQARFSPSDSSRGVVWTWLRPQPDGRYKAANLVLNQGSWLMTLTGSRNSRFEFSLEQPVTVR